jgi:hypothetical protein
MLKQQVILSIPADYSSEELIFSVNRERRGKISLTFIVDMRKIPFSLLQE